MIYTENIFICLAAPLLIAAYMLRGETKRFIVFFIIGITICLISAYINLFFVNVAVDNGRASMTAAQAMVRITPVCEEALKALPVFMFMGLTRPKRGNIIAVALAVGLGFATFENCCLITLYGAPDFLYALIRGFAAGATHTICAAILGYGLAMVRGYGRLVMPAAFALLCASSTFHAIYNFLISSQGAAQTAGYILPVVTAAGILLWQKRPGKVEI